MSLKDPLALGTVFPPRAVAIDDEYLGRYLDGIGARDNLWYVASSPYGRPICPATIFFYEPSNFLIAEGSYALRHHDIGRNPFNSGAEWRSFRPAFAGETITLEQSVAGRWLNRGREWAIFELTARNGDGEILSSCRFKESWASPPDYEPALEVRSGRSGDLAVSRDGALLGTSRIGYTFEMSVAFCRPEKDFHTDRELARVQGFPDVVLSGPQFCCQMAELMTRIFGRGFIEGGSINVNMLRPVLAGETITAHARDAGHVQDADGATLHKVAIWCENEKGETTAGGVATARMVAEDYRPGVELSV